MGASSKFRMFVGMTASFCLISSFDSAAQVLSEQVEKVVTESKAAIVKIHVTGTNPSGEEVDKDGTGFFVGSDDKRSYIVTAQHLIGSSATEQSKNADWEIENGRIERKIEISSLDATSSLVPRTGVVHVLPAGPEGVDFAILMIEQGKFPRLTLGNPLAEKESVHNVILLGFGKGSSELTRPFQIGTGQLSGMDYVTSLPSREGESGAPWIDLASGQVFAVASGAQNSRDGAKNISVAATLIQVALAVYLKGAANAVLVPLDTNKPAEEKIPKRPVPPEFIGLDVIYFDRSLDGAVIKKAMDDAGIKWRGQHGDEEHASNVISCGSNKGLPAAKKLATLLLDAGVQITGIAPQRSPISNKLTVEYYPQYSRQPLLKTSTMEAISKCPTWAEVPSSTIKVENACDYGRMDIYLRYFHPFQNRWTTTARFGLGPGESWVVTDEDSNLVGSGRAYILIAAVTSADYTHRNVGELGPAEDGGRDALDSIPDRYFHKEGPVVRYGCPE